MKIAKYKKKNIFCIEGDWSNDLRDESSILTALQFLKHNSLEKPNFIYRRGINNDGFCDLLKTSCLSKYEKFSILYLAAHGESRLLNSGKKKTISIDKIAEILDGKAKNKIVHFGSCQTLHKVSKKEMINFLSKTGAIAVSGYTKKIDFIPSTFLDILFFETCQKYHKMYLIERDMKQYYSQLCRQMGFKMFYVI